MSHQEVYIFELDEIHPSPEELATFFEVSISDVRKALDRSVRKGSGLCRGFHICWNDRRRPDLYKPVRIIEKDLVFPSIRHMAYFYRTDEQYIRDALKRSDGFWEGWHLEYVKK